MTIIRHIPKISKGFTLIEISIVLALIGILSAIGSYAYSNIQDRAKAQQIYNDFKAIEKAWRMWQADTDELLPLEGIPSNIGNHPDNHPCNDTDHTEISNTIIWGLDSSPIPKRYLSEIPHDPIYKREYTYDNDGNSGGVGSGVNVAIEVCSGEAPRYLRIADMVDRMIDKGSDIGANSGRFGWLINADNEGAFIYKIATDSNK